MAAYKEQVVNLGFFFYTLESIPEGILHITDFLSVDMHLAVILSYGSRHHPGQQKKRESQLPGISLEDHFFATSVVKLGCYSITGHAGAWLQVLYTWQLLRTPSATLPAPLDSWSCALCTAHPATVLYFVSYFH